jgi:SAM-dependent methyltransferase
MPKSKLIHYLNRVIPAALRSMHGADKNEPFWDKAVRDARERGKSPQDVSMPPGIMFFENRYLWERSVMEPISGKLNDTVTDWFWRTHIGRKVDRVLSICCGTGFWERTIVSRDFANRVDAFDGSVAAIEWARDLAVEEGLQGINYWHDDVNTIQLEKNSYDVVMSMAALHHVLNLEHVMQEVSGALKPGGLLIYDEYVGPNRIQWDDKTLQIVNSILEILPDRYKVKTQYGNLKTEENRVPIERMIQIDPTEAIRSEDIIRLSEKYFDVVDRKFYGGAILFPLFMNIVGNFDADRESDRLTMDFCLNVEKILLREKVILPNFAVMVCRTKLT